MILKHREFLINPLITDSLSSGRSESSVNGDGDGEAVGVDDVDITVAVGDVAVDGDDVADGEEDGDGASRPSYQLPYQSLPYQCTYQLYQLVFLLSVNKLITTFSFLFFTLA